MVFCGQCGYQLAPGDKTCPRCGAKTDVDLIEHDPGSYNPTEISHAILEQASPPPTVSPTLGGPTYPQIQGEAQGQLILGPGASNEHLANEATTMMNAPTYAPQPAYPGYPTYPQQGGYGYTPAGYQPQQSAQAAVIAQILETSRKGKVTSLLLILFGLLLLISAIVVFLLNQQGVIF